MPPPYSLLGFCLLVQFSYAQNKAPQLDVVAGRYASLNKFNGSVLVAQKGKVLLQQGYGYRDVAERKPNNPQTIFQVGSITKEFTAAIILKLAAMKKLALTDLLSHYYPDFPEGNRITLQHLLTHTSGIFNYTDTKEIWQQSSEPTNEAAVLKFLKSKPLDFMPGEQYKYSNSGYMLLAYIIQKITGKSYERVVSDLIFKPLHMTRSGFYFTALKDSNKATGYWKFSAAEYQPGPLTHPTQFIGSGEMYSTVQDLFRWHQALQAGTILSKPLQQQAYHSFKKEYGYGWEMMDSINGKPIVGHKGRMLNGFESRMMRVPQDDVLIVLLTNSADGPYLKTVAQDMLAILYQKPYTLPDKPLELNKEQLRACTGKYGASKDRYLEINVLDGHLFLKDGDHVSELIPLSTTKLRSLEHEGESIDFELEMDSNGVARSITAVIQNVKRKTLQKLVD